MESNSATRDGFVKTKAYGRIHYREAGKGPALMLMHTNGASAHQFEAVAPLLAKHFRVISWDMPGHGDSDRIQRHYSMEDHAKAMAALMTALKIKAAHISGASVGGTLTLAFASLFPARTLTAVPVETPCRNDEEWGANWHHTEGNFGLPMQTTAQIKERVAVVDAALETRWNIDRCKAGAWAMVDVMWGIREFNAVAAAKKIKKPMMIVYGKRGPTIALKDRLTGAAPKAKLVVLENSGHFPMLDEPSAFASLLIKFCGGK
ncbi:MAG: alpha/beta hydrolase [Burkholderiales bacterium]